MTLDEFVAEFASQFDETDKSLVTASTNFKDLDEWSSLTLLTIIAFADEKFGVAITGKEIQSVDTVSDLYNKIVSLRQKT